MVNCTFQVKKSGLSHIAIRNNSKKIFYYLYLFKKVLYICLNNKTKQI